MVFDKGICRQLMLLIWLSSSVAFSASQPASSAIFLKSPSSFLSGFSSSLRHGHAIVQLGGYWGKQGKAQHINIEGLIGDEFTVTDQTDSNGLVGLGYFLDGQKKELFEMTYGINAFYLPKTGVMGNIIQENLFTNLSYRYNVTHYPLYAVAKSTIKTKFPKYTLTMDAGIGPNFMNTNSFKEISLDGVTIPDNIFSGHTTATFSATAGIGMKIDHVFGAAPLECGYRFFYLGQGSFNKNTNQLLNTLSTGNNYANALMCAVII